MKIQYRHELPLLLDYFKLPKIAIEVGVAGGAFSEELLNNGIEFIYCIDSWANLNQLGDGSYPQEWHEDNFRQASSRLSKYGNRVKILRGLSKNMHVYIPDNSVSLCYLDGNHNLDGVIEDLNNYYPKLIEGGIMAGHDYPNYEGVKQAVEEFCKNHNKIVNLIPQTDPTNSSFWFRK